MKQVQRILADYSADLFGTCSALYELGGMVVMDDASGCNSTYDTHDEPRWFDIDSMIYITALSENDAVMGNDEKIIEDVCEAALARRPKFIALCGSPIAMMMGTDFKGLARVIEKRTGIPSFGILSSGMESYQYGASQAFAEIVKRFCPDKKMPVSHSDIRVNIIGVTPLDFSITGNAEALVGFFTQNGCTVVSSWAMNNTLETLSLAGTADVNIVVSSTGTDAAAELKKKYGTPYITGIPAGKKYALALLNKIRGAAGKSETDTCTTEITSVISEQYRNAACGIPLLDTTSGKIIHQHEEKLITPVYIIGEPVFAESLRNCLESDYSLDDVRIIFPFKQTCGLLRKNDSQTEEEDDIVAILKNAGTVIADPLYRRALPKNKKTVFIDFPHEAYSGRLYRPQIPVFIGSGMNRFLENK